MTSIKVALANLALGISISASPFLGSEQAAAQTRRVPTVASVCAPCHGLNGIGRNVETPNIAGQNSIYLRNQLMAFKKGQRRHPEMKYVARELFDRELDELVLYYSMLPPP